MYNAVVIPGGVFIVVCWEKIIEVLFCSNLESKGRAKIGQPSLSLELVRLIED
jgi:hypothetical protein